jgi:hypothetical protein
VQDDPGARIRKPFSEARYVGFQGIGAYLIVVAINLLFEMISPDDATRPSHQEIEDGEFPTRHGEWRSVDADLTSRERIFQAAELHSGNRRGC